MDSPGGQRPAVAKRHVTSYTQQEMEGADEVIVTSTAIVVEEWQESAGFLHSPNPSPFPIKAIILDRVRGLLGLLVLSLFFLTFILQPFRIPSESMERTLLVGDFLLVNKVVFASAGPWGWLLPYRQPVRGDTLVFRFPLDGDDHIVKRIVGVGGDALHLRNGVVYRNGVPLIEPYTRQVAALWPRFLRDPFRDDFPNARYVDPGVDAHWWFQLQRVRSGEDVVVPGNDYFVLGDNRNYSRDSRYWGFVPTENVVGMPMLIYFSVREPSRTDPDPSPAQDDRLGNSTLGRLFRFARWDRVLRVVR